MNKIQLLLQEALVNTMLTALGHLALTFAQRNPSEGQVGSRWSFKQTPASLIAAAAHAEVYDAGANAFGSCEYYRLPLPGMLGILPIEEVLSRRISLEDPKKTTGTSGGGVQAILDVTPQEFEAFGRPVGFTVVALGREEEGAPLQMFTVHPGDVSGYVPALNKPELIGQTMTGAEAKALGVVIVKLRVVG